MSICHTHQSVRPALTAAAPPARAALTTSPSRLGPPAAEPGNPWDLSMLDPMNSGGNGGASSGIISDGASNIDLVSKLPKVDCIK